MSINCHQTQSFILKKKFSFCLCHFFRKWVLNIQFYLTALCDLTPLRDFLGGWIVQGHSGVLVKLGPQGEKNQWAFTHLRIQGRCNRNVSGYRYEAPCWKKTQKTSPWMIVTQYRWWNESVPLWVVVFFFFKWHASFLANFKHQWHCKWNMSVSDVFISAVATKLRL